MKIISGLFGIIGIIVLVLIILPHPSTSNSAAEPAPAAQENAAPAKPDPRDSPQDAMDVSLISWQKGGFGAVMIVTLRIKNNNDFAVKDALVRCQTFGPSGTVVSGHLETIYDVIRPHSRKTVRNLNFGFIDQQSATANCDLIYAKPA